MPTPPPNALPCCGRVPELVRRRWEPHAPGEPCPTQLAGIGADATDLHAIHRDPNAHDWRWRSDPAQTPLDATCAKCTAVTTPFLIETEGHCPGPYRPGQGRVLYVAQRQDERPSIVTRSNARSGKHTNLPPRLDLQRHSPTGLAWGYGGSGAAQLALALAVDALPGPDRTRRALQIYMDLKRTLVAYLPDRGWTLTQRQVRARIVRLEAEAQLRQEVGVHLDDQAEGAAAQEDPLE